MDELSVLHPFSLRKAPGFSGVCFPSLRPCLSGRDRFPRKRVETGKVGLAIRAPFQFVARCSFFLGLCAATMSAQPVPKLTSVRSEEHTSELQSPCNLVCRLLLEKKKQK